MIMIRQRSRPLTVFLVYCAAQQPSENSWHALQALDSCFSKTVRRV